MSIDELYSEQVENNIIGKLLVKFNDNKHILSEIEPADFYQRSLQYILNTIGNLSNNNKPIDIVSVSELLKFNKELDLAGGRKHINDLALNVELNTNLEFEIKTLIKYSKKRSLITLCNQAIDEVNNFVDVDDTSVLLSSRVQSLINRTASNKFKGLTEGIANMLDSVGNLIESNKNIFGLDTSFEKLNKALNGLCGGRLYLLAARPSVGKSALAQQIAEFVAVNNNVLFFSLEMGVEEYVQRSIYRRTGYNQSHITGNLISKETILDSYNQAGVKLDKLHLNIVDDSSCTLNKIERSIQESIVRLGSCDLIVLDYLQLMKSDNKSKREDYDIVTENSRGLKQLARKYNIPILALAQLSRACETRADKRPLLSDLRDSGSLEQDADVVLFLYRDEIYNPRNKGFAELIIAKNRQGQRGKIIPMSFNGSKVEFKEIVDNRLTNNN